MAYDRDFIIKQYRKNNYNFRVENSTTKKKSVVTRPNSTTPVPRVIATAEDFTDDDLSDEVFSDDDSLPDAGIVKDFGVVKATPITVDDFNPISQLTYPEKLEKMFEILTGLNWCDRDSGVRSASSLSRINCGDLRQLMPTMIKLADELKVAVNNCTGALESLDQEQTYNFLFHIIAKGQQFYFSCVVDPEFCTYLIPTEQYQPLYTILKKKYSITDHDDF